MVILSDLLNFNKFFHQCRQLEKAYPSQFQLRFHLLGITERTQNDLDLGLMTNIRIFNDRISFVCTNLSPMDVTVEFTAVQHIELAYYEGGLRTKVWVYAKASQLFCRIPPGPDR